MKQPIDEPFACLANVEPTIDDLHRARLWTGIQSRLFERSRQHWPWRLSLAFVSGGAAVVLVLALARVFLQASPLPTAVNVPAGGPKIQALPQALPAEALPSSAEGLTAVIAPYLVSGTASVESLEGRQSRLEVPAGGLVRAQIAEGARVALVGPAVMAVVKNDAAGLTVSVERGLFLCDYDHRSGRALRIVSPNAETVVTGTLFAIEAHAERTQVSVVRGAVSVTRERQTVRVGSGRALSTDSPTDQPIEAATATVLAEHDASIVPPSGSSGVLSLSVDSHAGSAWIGDHVLGVPPVSARLPSGRTRVVFSSAAGAKTVKAAFGSPTQVVDTLVLPGKSTVALVAKPGASYRARERASSAAPETRTERQPQAAPTPRAAVPDAGPILDEPPGDSASLIYRAAEGKMRARDLGGARRVLESLVQRFPQDPLASTARYELARAAFADQDLDETRRYLDELSTRSLATSLAEPAQYLRCRLEVASKRRGQAIVCLTALLERSPASPHAAQALAWLASYRLEEGCSLALPYLKEYLRLYPHGSFAVVARQRRTECEQ